MAVEKEDSGTLSNILRDIATIKQQNDQKIEHINTTKVVNTFKYFVSRSIVERCLKLDVIEQQVEQNANEITKAWCSSTQMIVIPDIFNDKLNYSCQTYSDLIRLNSEMFTVAQKYELFGDSEKARQEILKFSQNFRLIEAALDQIEKSLSHGRSKLEEIKHQLNGINSQLENLMKENVYLSFFDSTTVPKGRIACYGCGQILQLMRYYRNDAESSRNDQFRVDGVSAVCTAHIASAQNGWIFIGTY